MPPQQKRTLEETDSFLEGVKVLLLDIEGTITPINFVKDTLFPYVTKNIETFLKKNFEKEETKSDISALRELVAEDKDAIQIPAEGTEEVIQAVVKNVKALVEKNSKATALKQLQGHMWKEAYESKTIVGELFDDVNPVLEQLFDEEFRLYIYSSGSIEAQKLLVKYSNEGDISEMFSGFFDTTSGPKIEADSYKKIKKEIDPEGALEPDEILFLTDNPAEATAACEAGLQAIIVDRSIEQEGGFEITEEVRKNFPVIDNLNDLFGEDDEDDEEFGQMAKRPHLDGNGEFDGEDDEDDDDDVEGVEGEDDEDLGEDEEGEDGEEDEEA